MRRWWILAAPALALSLLPPACSGTESGNPRCARVDTCRVDLDLDIGPYVGGIQEARGFLYGDAPAPRLAFEDCGIRREVGELRWSAADATREPDGSLTVRPATTADAEPSWIDHGGIRLVVEGSITITEDAWVSGELLVVQAHLDAAAGDLETLRIDGELDVPCPEDEPGVVLGAADGSGLLVQCNSTDADPVPCDDTPSGC